MKSYEIKIGRTAVKQLKKLPDGDRKSISDKINSLTTCARPRGARKLKGSLNGWRVRQGRYRVIYVIDRTVITIHTIAHRKSAYT